MALSAVAGTVPGEWMGKNVGAANLTEKMYPGLSDKRDWAEDAYMHAYNAPDKDTEAGKARIKRTGDSFDKKLKLYDEKYKSIRSAM